MHDEDENVKADGLDRSDDHELMDVLIAISVVAKCLARNLERHGRDGQEK